MPPFANDAATRLLDAMPDGVLLVDHQGRIVWTNEHASAMFGRPRAELVGSSVDSLIPAPQRGGHAHKRARYHAAPSMRRMGTGLGLAALRHDGTHFPVDISLAPFDHGGEAYVLAVVRDLSDRYQLERQLFESQRLEAVGRLAGGVAHDFNNALAVILGVAALAAETLPTDSPLRQDLDDIRTAADHAAAVTRQLLAFSRKQVTLPQPLRLSDVVREAEGILRRMLGASTTLSLHLADDLGIVMADPTQLTQVLFNLALNAHDVMPLSGSLTIEATNVELDDAYAGAHLEVRSGPYVLLAISDTGAGMDRDTATHIFEPFFTTKQGKGFGLGLASVHGIIKQAGGHIWVYSELGRGTTFKIYLPRVQLPVVEAARATAPPLRGSAPSGGNETLLIVEDEPLVRSTVTTMLRRRGYRVLVAADAAEALSVGTEHAGPIHLLITDVVMPGTGGRQLAEQLATLRPSIAVLYMSGYTENSIVHHGALDPGVELISKPFSPDALAARVRALLDRRREPAAR